MCVLLLSLGKLLPAQAPRYDVRDFFKNPDKTRFQLSPSGQLISYLAPWNKRMNLFVKKLNASAESAVRITGETERGLGQYMWKNNNTLVYLRDFGGDENFHLFVATADGKSQKDLTPFKGVKVGILDPLENSEDEMLIEMNKENPEVFDVYRLNVKSGKLNLEVKNPGDVSTWVTDHDGVVRMAISTIGTGTKILSRKTATDPFEVILKTDFRTTVTPVVFTPDNRHVYALSNFQGDKIALVEMDITTGTEVRTVFEDKDADLSDVFYSRKQKKLTAVGYEKEKYTYHFLDQSTADIYDRLVDKLKGQSIFIYNHDKEENNYIIQAYSDRSRGAYYHFRKSTGELTKIHDTSPWLKESDMCDMQPVSYTTSDGMTIHGYLTLPNGAKPSNLPTIIHPHGGPWARDSWGWNPEVQFLANRGYAVLQMNFRGSTGYGRKFWESSFKEWGQAMQDDINDGIKWLIASGIADKNRIGIYGASYGGYATLSGITRNPELYAAAVDYVGVSNLFTFLNSIPAYWEPYREMMYEMIGNPKEENDSLMMRKTSPLFNIDKIICPLLIAQGANDPRVKQAESDQMVVALQKRNIPVEYILKANEGHGFMNEENKFEFYNAMDTFLEKHVKNRQTEAVPVLQVVPIEKK